MSLLLALLLPQVKIIVDTDFNTDCDDPGALAVAHALADNGECEILATVVSSRYPTSPQALDAVNTYYGRPGLPIGVSRKGVVRHSRYADHLAAAFPHDTPPLDRVRDAVDVYREVLAAQPDGSVVIVTVGYTINVAELLRSPGGPELVRAKVREWVCMGGNFFDLKEEVDPNLRMHPDATIQAVKEWPTPVTFAPREVCSNPSPIRAGARLKDAPADSPVRAAYEKFFGGVAKDRHCADLIAVIYAVRGLRDCWDMESKGSMHFLDDKADFEWRPEPDSATQRYLVMKGGYKVYANKDEISRLCSDLLVQPPRRR